LVQSTFASLAMSNREFYRPNGFWKAFKDYDGEPLNVREHQDAYEFFTRLQVTLFPCFLVPTLFQPCRPPRHDPMFQIWQPQSERSAGGKAPERPSDA